MFFSGAIFDYIFCVNVFFFLSPANKSHAQKKESGQVVFVKSTGGVPRETERRNFQHFRGYFMKSSKIIWFFSFRQQTKIPRSIKYSYIWGTFFDFFAAVFLQNNVWVLFKKTTNLRSLYNFCVVQAFYFFVSDFGFNVFYIYIFWLPFFGAIFWW